MAQKRKKAVVAQQPGPNIINQVALEPTAEEIWMSALADIGQTVRAQNGGTAHIIKVGEETAHAQPSGVLTLATVVDGEKVEMDIPPGMWRLRDPAQQTF